jgi:hypothetical protein
MRRDWLHVLDRTRTRHCVVYYYPMARRCVSQSRSEHVMIMILSREQLAYVDGATAGAGT